MPKQLPKNASLEHLKEQAKDLLKAHRSNDADSIRRLSEHLPSFHTNGEIRLHDAQSAIAREYGFPSWAALKSHVENPAPYRRQYCDPAVRKATSRGWDEWFAILDEWGAMSKNHKDRATYLWETQGLDGWWAQMVTVEYERERGIRRVNQRCDGSYVVSVSKTIAAPVERAFLAWVEEAERARWLDESIVLRTVTEPKSARFNWADGRAILAVGIYEKSAHKCQVVVQHPKLTSEREVAKYRAFWVERLERLKAMLEA